MSKMHQHMYYHLLITANVYTQYGGGCNFLYMESLQLL